MEWPPNNGFTHFNLFETTLDAGMIISRYGDENGSYVANLNTPFWQRSLLLEYYDKPFRAYRVLKPIMGVLQGRSAAHFGMLGCGTQYKLPQRIDYLIYYGYLESL